MQNGLHGASPSRIHCFLFSLYEFIDMRRSPHLAMKGVLIHFTVYQHDEFIVVCNIVDKDRAVGFYCMSLPHGRANDIDDCMRVENKQETLRSVSHTVACFFALA